MLTVLLLAGAGRAVATRLHHRPPSPARSHRRSDRSDRHARKHRTPRAPRRSQVPTAAPAVTSALNEKRVCVYDHNSISGLAAFATEVGRKIVDCAMVYTGSPDWSGWVDPWFLHHPDPDLDWALSVRHSPTNDRRQLIISQPLIPAGLADTDWRARGAVGAYDGYARQFAQTLVDDGVGEAIIRLSWEMNGTWNVDSIGSTQTQRAQWVAFWRRTVLAMRSVPGAHFRFVWCINNIYRNIPFNSYYPGDDVVDIIGDDVYDAGVAAGADRWSTIYGRAGGLRDLVAFARLHRKPISIPEWGIAPQDGASLGGGDDATYVHNLAEVIATNNTAFQTYFYVGQFATQLQRGPRSLAAYRASFGDTGAPVGRNNGTALIARKK